MSLPALREAGVDLAIATIFTEPSDTLDGAEAAGRAQMDLYRDLETQRELSVVRSRRDVNRADAVTPGVVLLMEGADPIRSPEHVTQWFEDGLRIVGLTWAEGTRYAGGDRTHGPLTTLGRELVAALDQHGIVHDVSHLSDDAFDGVMAAARGPIVATHSNCRALVGDAQRHLRDDQIREIGRRGGVIGLNLFSRFLVAEGRAAVTDCVAHLEHVAGLMGHRRGVALGSDMDGGFGPDALPVGLDDPRKLETLAAALGDAGWSADEIDGFRGGNWRRLLTETLPG